MSVRSVVAVVAVGLAVPVAAGLVSAPLGADGGTGLELVEGCIVGGTLLLGEAVGLRLFGRYLRRRAFAERLAARNARIRSAHAYSESVPL